MKATVITQTMGEYIAVVHAGDVARLSTFHVCPVPAGPWSPDSAPTMNRKPGPRRTPVSIT